MRRALTLLATAATGLALAAPAQAAGPYPGLNHLFDFGSKGTGAGQLFNPAGLAVNDVTGDLYVADQGNNRIDQFDADGNFIRAWGEDVVASGPDDSGAGFEVCDVQANPSDVCKAGAKGFASGSFDNPAGIAVDNSGGLAEGSVYVQDSNNLRIQRFDAEGNFVLMWGKEVNQTSGGDVCPRPGFPADACKAGVGTSEDSGFNSDGIFGGSWLGGGSNRIAVDGAGRVYASSGEWRNAFISPRVVRFDSGGAVLDKISGAPAPARLFGAAPHDIAVGAAGNAYVSATADDGQFYGGVRPFASADFTPSGLTEIPDLLFDSSKGSQSTHLAVDPANQYLFVVDSSWASPCKVTADQSAKVIEYHPGGQVVDCSSVVTPGLEGLQEDHAHDIGGITVSPTHRLYMTVTMGGGTPISNIRVFAAPVAEAPAVGAQSVEPLSHSALVKAPVTANLAPTDVHVEYGTAGPCSGDACASTPDLAIGTSRAPEPQGIQLNELAPDTTYHYRVAATNSQGTDYGPDRLFHTFPAPLFDPSCPNNLARQQTGAAFLADCRAYELVSAQDTGGYNVASDLLGSAGPLRRLPRRQRQGPLRDPRRRDPRRLGNPTNRGPDPYLATRDEANQRWDTSYVGIPADAPEGPLASPLSPRLCSALTGPSTPSPSAAPKICSPCFEDGTSGVPVRFPDGALVQGMAGPVDPGPEAALAGVVHVPLSADGTHLVFGSTAKFIGGANNDGTNATIYDRNLLTGKTQVVSKLPTGQTIKNGLSIAELDISADGSRIVIGQLVSTDSVGNPRYHLYLHVGESTETIDLTPGATHGVIYGGMTEDASMVYFTTKDALVTAADPDSDESADLFRADVGAEATAATLTRVSTGDSSGDTDTCDPAGDSFNPANWNVVPGGPTDCSVVAIGGGGGVGPNNGAVYFLSPESLDGTGTDGAPNLYRALPGSSPQRVATLESSLNQALPAPTHGFERSFGDFDNGEGVAIDGADGSTYVYDPGASVFEPGPGATVKKFDPAGKLDPGFGAGGVLDGSNSPGGSLGALGNPTGTAFPASVPTEVAVDNTCFAKHLSGSACTTFDPSNGDLYVSDLVTGGIKKFGPDGHFISQISGVGTESAYVIGVAVSPANGNVYVVRMTTNGTTIRARIFDSAGTGVKGETALSESTMPLGIAVDGTGRLYLADNTSTKVYNATSLALIGTLYSGTSKGVAVDPADNHVYVDTGSSVVEFNATGTQIGSPFGAEDLGDSISLAASSGRLVVSNRADGDVVAFGPRVVQSDHAYDNPLVIDTVKDSRTLRSADFQTTPDGDYAAFPTTLALDGSGFDSAGHEEVYRYEQASGELDCASCSPTLAQPASDASLPANGLGLTDDGRVFFNSAESLVLRDANAKRDAYEWKQGKVELISSGQSNVDSSLLSISADGTDAFFFTRERLADDDQNGNAMKLYDARADGGFFVVPPPPDCAASDECHGPGSQAPAEAQLGTLNGSGGNAAATPPTVPPSCAKGKVRRHGRCVSKHGRGKKGHQRKKGQRQAAHRNHSHRGPRR